MSVLGDLAAGATGGVLGGANEIIKTVSGDQAARDAAAAQQLQSVQASYQAEWAQRGTRTWFDVAVDGINRLVRPAYTVGIVYLFVLAVLDPAAFRATMLALQEVPRELWVGIGVITTFWFGGKFAADLGVGRGPVILTPAAPPAKDPPVRSALSEWMAKRRGR